MAKSSTSAPVTKPIRFIFNRSLGGFCAMPFTGSRRKVNLGSTAAQIFRSSRRQRNSSRKVRSCKSQAKRDFVDSAAAFVEARPPPQEALRDNQPRDCPKGRR